MGAGGGRWEVGGKCCHARGWGGSRAGGGGLFITWTEAGGGEGSV